MDGCGLSPIDSFVYCVAGIGTSCSGKPKAVVIRLGSAHQDASAASFEYVAVLPCDAVRPSVPWWSGSFDASGAYHIITGLGGGDQPLLYVLDGNKRPDSLEGYAQHDAAGIADLSSMAETGVLSQLTPYDLATKQIGNVSYGFFISSGGGARSYTVSQFDDHKWHGIQAKPGTNQDLTKAQKWGALWTYGNEVYAAAPNGEGVWRLLLDDLDYDSISTIRMEYVGPSDAVTDATAYRFVDAFACMSASDPYAPPVCPDNSATIVVSAALFSASDCTCNAGYTGPDGGTCVACAAGTYKAGTGDAACDVCPANSASPAGSTVSTACTCNAGYTGPDGGTCVACAAGTYKTVEGPSACNVCAAGKYAKRWNWGRIQFRLQTLP